MGPIESIKTCLTKKFFTFKGRATRSEFWWFYAFTIIAFYILAIIGVTFLPETLATYVILMVWLALLIPFFSVSVRRLHDVGKSGGWLLLRLIPYAGLVLLYFFCKDSDVDNKYGKGSGPAIGATDIVRDALYMRVQSLAKGGQEGAARLISDLEGRETGMSGFMLSRMYLYGIGVAMDEAKSAHYLKKAAQMDCVWADWDMAMRYEKGFGGFAQNVESAASWKCDAVRKGCNEELFNNLLMDLFGRTDDGNV